MASNMLLALMITVVAFVTLMLVGGLFVLLTWVLRRLGQPEYAPQLTSTPAQAGQATQAAEAVEAPPAMDKKKRALLAATAVLSYCLESRQMSVTTIKPVESQPFAASGWSPSVRMKAPRPLWPPGPGSTDDGWSQGAKLEFAELDEDNGWKRGS